MPRRRLPLIAAAALALVAIPVAVGVAAVTDNMFMTANFQTACADGGHFCQTDNATLTVYRQSSLSSSGVAVIRDTLDNS